MSILEIIGIILVMQSFILIYYAKQATIWLKNIYEMTWAIKKMTVNGIQVDKC